ncbi:MAG TPA: hypothetical protein VMT19_05290 [Thermoanaerobaculaceae bacterium]|nr:hypothetical protein [Thermoanaerobaculaceae bacterium]
MKLGIAVVYMVREGSECLLDLHLDHIRRHTAGEFSIYGCVNRLATGLRSRVSACPEFVALELPLAALRESEEHAHYLERLIDAALSDGATHVAVLHVDSFPVRPGWSEDLAGRLTPSCPFAAAVRESRLDRKPFTAGMVISGDFLRERRPRFLLGEAERGSAAYRAYRRRFRHHPDSGVGYGFLAFREGLDWLQLERTNRGEDHRHFGSIYGDTFFHLGAAAWKRKDFPGSRGPTVALDIRARLSGGALGLVPKRVRVGIKRALNRTLPALDIGRKYAANEAAFLAVRERLFSDPDAYIRFLRFG